MQYVYILENKYSPFVYKIGWTSRHPNVRAMEISQGTGVVGAWEVSYFWQVEDGYWLEQRIFKELVQFRLERSEMFHMPNMSSQDVYNRICQFINQTGESPRIAREQEEREQAYQRECNQLKKQISDRVRHLIQAESEQYKGVISSSHYFYWGSCILATTWWIYDDKNILGSWFIGIILGGIIGLLLAIPITFLWMRIEGDNHPNARIDAIKQKYNKYQNLPDNLTELERIHSALSTQTNNFNQNQTFVTPKATYEPQNQSGKNFKLFVFVLLILGIPFLAIFVFALNTSSPDTPSDACKKAYSVSDNEQWLNDIKIFMLQHPEYRENPELAAKFNHAVRDAIDTCKLGNSNNEKIIQYAHNKAINN